MLGRIVPVEKGSNEAASTFDIFARCSSYFTICFSRNTGEKTNHEGLEFFSRSGDGACAARRLVAAVVMQGGKIGRGSIYAAVFAGRLVQRQRSHYRRSSTGEAEGLSESRLRHESAKAPGNGLSHRGQFLEHSHAAGQPVYGAVVVSEGVHASSKLQGQDYLAGFRRN